MGDNELVAFCLRGRGEEFRKIVDIYQGPVVALAMNILGNRQDAEDAGQETFIQVYRNLDRFDPGQSFKNWIFTILYRRCLDQLKKKRRFRTAFERAKHEAPHGIPPDPGIARRHQPLSGEILRCLKPKERAVLTLWANEDMTPAEISGVLGCAPSTARVYLFNARKKIKSFLEKSHGPF
jgi:RNA polymerase sigma-70 factor (ECF subfamily)